MASKQIKLDDIRVEIQKGTTNTLFAEWKWNVDNTDSFKVRWYYRTGDNVRFDGGEYTIESRLRSALYTPPSNAVRVAFKIRPISKTHEVNGTETEYWTSIWSEGYKYDIYPDTTPKKTEPPTVTLSGYNLTCELDIYDDNVHGGEFQVVANDKKKVGSSGVISKIKFNHISWNFNTTPGNIYKVRFRPIGLYTDQIGEWSEYSEPVSTIPQEISSITGYALTETSVRLEWPKVPIGVESYIIEYTTNIDYFDASTEVSSVTIEGKNSYVIVTGLETGQRYFFRVRVSNDQGASPWSSITDVILGTIPNPPTTWMSRSTIQVGESVILYWSHNSADGSKESGAKLEFIVNGAIEVIDVEPNMDDEGISQYVYNTSDMSGSDINIDILWSVSTKGILPTYGKYSVQRSFKVLTPPIAYINLFKKVNWWWNTFNFNEDTIFTAMGDFEDSIDDDPIVKSYPLFIVGNTEPKSQKLIACHFSISPLESYQTINYMGEETWINDGDIIYEADPVLSDYSMISNDHGYAVSLRLFPEDIILENGIEYKLVFTAILDTGLTAEAEYIFSVAFDEDPYDIDAEIGVDKDTVSTYVRPYCVNDQNDLTPYVTLSVYRRDFDGKFVQLSKGIDNIKNTIIVDPHPPLNFARYRIVGLSGLTGRIMFNDLPSYPIGEKTIIIQWDDSWKPFNIEDGEELADPVMSGSMLRLPYNISTSENGTKDVELVEYIGRENPVSYYGTQIGQTANYTVDIERDDVETLYALRRLSRYMGKVYVREPNGSGYWADISVSWNINNKAVIIPVSISVTRVEGGV